MVTLRLIRTSRGSFWFSVLVRFEPTFFGDFKAIDRSSCLYDGATSHEFLIYQLSIGGYWPPMAFTDNGVLGNDSGENV